MQEEGEDDPDDRHDRHREERRVERPGQQWDRGITTCHAAPLGRALETQADDQDRGQGGGARRAEDAEEDVGQGGEARVISSRATVL